MQVKKTWLIVNFHEGNAIIEASLNYETKIFYLQHGSNDINVTFKSTSIKMASTEMKDAMDRAKCVQAALKFVKQELEL